ncbi:MAG TPA: hypothetical protein VGH28_25205 [Polyangiaceae bacterium]|jgi:hypothetical protein
MGCAVTDGRFSLAALVLASITAFALVLARCDRAPEGAAGDDAAVVDTQLLAFLSLARSHHHEATILEQSGDKRGAIDALRKITTAPKPHDGEKLPEVEEVVADAYARIADLEVETNDTSNARKDVETGLRHAPDPTYFRGHLLEVYGVVEQTRASQLADAGQDAAAAEANAHAVTLLRQAVDVQEGVIGRALDGGAK